MSGCHVSGVRVDPTEKSKGEGGTAEVIGLGPRRWKREYGRLGALPPPRSRWCCRVQGECERKRKRKDADADADAGCR